MGIGFTGGLDQSEILSDGTPFDGSNIDAPISSSKTIQGFSTALLYTQPDTIKTVVNFGSINFDGRGVVMEVNNGDNHISGYTYDGLIKSKLTVVGELDNVSDTSEPTEVYIGPLGADKNGTGWDVIAGEYIVNGSVVSTSAPSLSNGDSFVAEFTFDASKSEISWVIRGDVSDNYSDTISSSPPNGEIAGIDDGGANPRLIIKFASQEVGI